MYGARVTAGQWSPTRARPRRLGRFAEGTSSPRHLLVRFDAGELGRTVECGGHDSGKGRGEHSRRRHRCARRLIGSATTAEPLGDPLRRGEGSPAIHGYRARICPQLEREAVVFPSSSRASTDGSGLGFSFSAVQGPGEPEQVADDLSRELERRSGCIELSLERAKGGV